MQVRFSLSTLLRGLLFVTVVLALAGLAAAQSTARVLITEAVDDNIRTTLSGNVHPLAQPEFDRGEAPDDMPLKRMLLVLKRSPEQETTLRILIDSQQDKSSPHFHQWLTPEEFGTQFGVSDYDLATVTNWLMASGFEVTDVSKGRTVIEFSGTAGQVKQAFGTAIHKFVVKGEEHWSNVNDPSIPSALAPAVAGLDSLHNFQKKAQSKFVGTYSEKSKKMKSPAPNYTFDGGCTQSGNCYALVPYDFATIYDLLPLWNATPKINGTGQTIAIVGRTDIDPTDPTDFWTLFGLDGTHAPQPTLVITPNGPSPGINGDEAEADIDIQWSGAAAPGATINFVTSASTETTDGVDLSALYIVNNNVAPVMSESYGQCEASLGQGGAIFYGLLWEQAAAQGITAMVSTGDNGAAGCDDPNFPAQFGLRVNGLASTPFNVAVGGTDFNQFTTDPLTYWKTTNDPITQESAKGYIPETTWNDSCANPLFQFVQGGTSNAETNCNNPAFSGFLDSEGGSGGVSQFWLKPSWQTGTPNDNSRDMPDISLFASNGFLGSFYVVCVKDLTGDVCDLDDFAGFGGTSVSSPAFAGIMALVNQKWGVQGNPNFVLYKLPAKKATAFHDVPSGSTIAMPCFKGTTNCTTQNNSHQFGILSGYGTGTNYDLATGLGSVDANVMVTNWNLVTFTATTTTLTLNSGNPVNVTHGALVPVTVSVSPTAATGDVALLVNPGTPGKPGIDFNTLGSGGTVTWSTSLLPGGTYKVIAHYEGDTSRGGSYSAPSANVTVNPENSSVYMPGVVIGTDNNGNPVYSTSVVYGTGGVSYLLRADILNAGGNFCTTETLGEIACPTGTVSFTDNGSPLDAGSYKLNSGGFTEDQTIQLTGGSHTLVGTYSGDASYKPSTSSGVVVTVSKATTSINNVAGPGTTNINQLFTVTATVASSSFGIAPTGTVTFLANGTPLTGTVQLNPINGDPNALSNAALGASLTTSIANAGTYTITATYSGDGNYTNVTVSNQASLVVKGPDFQFLVNPVPGTTLVNQNVVWNGTLTAINGYNKAVALTCGAGAPSTCTFTPSSVTPTAGGAPFTITVGSATATTYNFSIQGTDGTITRTAGPFTLVVNQDFSYPNSLPDTNAALPGQTTTTSMTLAPLGGGTFANNVTYSCAGGLPSGASCSFSPTQIGAGAGSTLVTITVTTAGPFTGAAGPTHKQVKQRSSLWLPLSLPLAGLVFVGLAGFGLPRGYKVIGMCSIILLAGLVISCGGGGGSSPPPPVGVSVTPTVVSTLYPNLTGAPAQTQQFTATVSNATNKSVTWAVAGGDASGTIDANGLYTAPTAVPAGAVTVTATAAADTSKSGHATVNIQTPTPSGTSHVSVIITEGTLTHGTTFDLIVAAP